MHAVIFVLIRKFTLVFRSKSATELMLHVVYYSTKNEISMSISMSLLNRNYACA